MCDPVIDEHFRRSLGERYTHLFASSSSASPASSSGGEGSSSTTTKSQPSTVSVTGLSGKFLDFLNIKFMKFDLIFVIFFDS